MVVLVTEVLVVLLMEVVVLVAVMEVEVDVPVVVVVVLMQVLHITGQCACTNAPKISVLAQYPLLNRPL